MSGSNNEDKKLSVSIFYPLLQNVLINISNIRSSLIPQRKRCSTQTRVIKKSFKK